MKLTVQDNDGATDSSTQSVVVDFSCAVTDDTSYSDGSATNEYLEITHSTSNPDTLSTTISGLYDENANVASADVTGISGAELWEKGPAPGNASGPGDPNAEVIPEGGLLRILYPDASSGDVINYNVEVDYDGSDGILLTEQNRRIEITCN
jgi:hypothetical protein